MPSLNEANADFWNDLCGSHLARVLGLSDKGPQSLEKYDQWYFDYYPYLLKFIRRENLVDKRVLEVGLGYGSLGQTLATEAKEYLGLDIAREPVEMMRHRLKQSRLPGETKCCPFPDTKLEKSSFDMVVSIGCFHHTGNLPGCVAEVYRLLRHGGVALIMIYNRHSYRHLRHSPWATLCSIFSDFIKYKNSFATLPTHMLRCYDADEHGRTAPYTEFLSKTQALALFSNFSSVQAWKENCADERFLGRWWKREKLRSWLGPLAGTDIYIRAVK